MGVENGGGRGGHLVISREVDEPHPWGGGHLGAAGSAARLGRVQVRPPVCVHHSLQLPLQRPPPSWAVPPPATCTPPGSSVNLTDSLTVSVLLHIIPCNSGIRCNSATACCRDAA